MEIVQLLEDVTANTEGQPVAIGDFRIINGPISLLVYGSGISATVNIKGTIATQDEVNEGTATFETITGGSFTDAAATALITQFTHIRADVESYSAGTISARMLL